MKARNWLFLASFLLMLKGAMDISIYFVQYLESGSQIYTDCTGADAQGQCTVYYLRKLWSMSVDSRYSGSDFPGESTKTTIPDDYGAHIVWSGLYRHGKLPGALWDGHSIRDAVSM